MHILINKKYLTLDNYKAKCALGKRGIGYKKKEGDLAGNLSKEKRAVIKNGGKIFFTSGRQHSASKLINEKLD